MSNLNETSNTAYTLQIWVDADACPVAIRDILLRVAQRTGIVTTFVANHALPLPPLPQVRSLQVPAGFDVADNEIVKRVQPQDVVITSDIPLAAEVVDRGARALSPKGELFNVDTIRARLNMRDFMESLRTSGLVQSRTAALSQSDRQAFANQLDKIIAKNRPRS